MQFNVPQFLDVEDKIVGPLTLKQFGYLAAGGGAVFMLYQFFQFWLCVLLAIPIMLSCLALAFVKINGRPFTSFLSSFFNYILKPKIFIWKRK